VDGYVTEAVTKAYTKTDADFLELSDHAESGSTATTVLIMGKRWVGGDGGIIGCHREAI